MKCRKAGDIGSCTRLEPACSLRLAPAVYSWQLSSRLHRLLCCVLKQYRILLASAPLSCTANNMYDVTDSTHVYKTYHRVADAVK